jgi:hypothetical protein
MLGSHSSTTSSPLTPPCSVTASLEPRVSVFPFFNRGAFLWQAAFCPSSASVYRCFKLCFLLVTCRQSSPFIWPSGSQSGCLGCCPLGWQLGSHLALSLRLLASAELSSTGPASPACSSREPSDLSKLNQGDPLGLLLDVP